ncbi:MAG: nicotinate-nucleotide adenylyltransferase [Microcystaceae cyanobacterium]
MIKTIALFGTSADPPTAGHQAILKWLAQRYDWVGVWASDNPYKNHQTDLKHRMAMLRLLIEDIDLPYSNLKVYQELSYLRSLMSVYQAMEIWGKEKDYDLVIGSDLVSQVPKWYEVKALLESVHLLIIPRPNYPINSQQLKTLENLGGKWHIADLNAPAVSSTAYRQQQDHKVVTQPIQNYIYRQKLYS